MLRASVATLCVVVILALQWGSSPFGFVMSRIAGWATGNRSALHILFIGNSYTYVNDLPQQLSALAAGEDHPIETEMVTEGGATLKFHWEKGNALAAIRKGRWDYIVLQEQSTLGPAPVQNGVIQISDPATFYKYARLFDKEIKNVGAKTILYLTWARRNAPQNQTLLTRAYTTLGNSLHDTVVPVGIAWANALKARPTLILHQEDDSHPNSSGTYLAACVFYASIYQKSPVGLPSRITSADGKSLLNSVGSTVLADLNAQDAEFLQLTAWQTVSSQGLAQPATPQVAPNLKVTQLPTTLPASA